MIVIYFLYIRYKQLQNIPMIQGLNDDQIYEQMKNHSEAKTIQNKVVDSRGNQKNFQYLYVDDQKYMLGEGSFGKVFICFHVAPERKVKLALKIIYIPEAWEQIKTIQHIVSTSRQQILALIKLWQNKHIIRMQDVIRRKNIIYILLEYCNERNLVYFFNKIRKEGIVKYKQINEVIVRYFFAQILNAFKQLNKLNFMHRDIKPSNILVNNGVLKIADFGLARQIIEGERSALEEHVGTMITAAPQIVFKEEYTNKCDIYSLGVILYWMIYDKYPFEKVPSRLDFTMNKLSIPLKSKYFQVSCQMQKLLKQMLAYQQCDRIDWIPLLQHQLFNMDNQNFKEIDNNIKEYYEKLKMIKVRETYGRNFMMHVESDDQFLDTTIPTAYYTFLRQIEGEQKFNKCVAESKNSLKQVPLVAHRAIQDEYKNQDIRIKFYRTLLAELQNFQVDNMFKKNRGQIQLIRTLLSYAIHKYLIYTINKIINELLFTIPPNIFNLQNLKDVQQLPLHQNFIQTIKQKIRVYEFTNKYSVQDVNKLQQKCKQYKINQYLFCLLDQINQSNYLIFLQQIDQCIIQMVYFIKPQISKVMTTKININGISNSFINKNIQFRSTIMLVHHMFMFSMQDQVFPSRFNKQFPYSTFIQTQQFKTDKNFKILAEQVQQILSRFQ